MFGWSLESNLFPENTSHARTCMSTHVHMHTHVCMHAHPHACTHAVTVYMKWPVKCNGVACKNPHPNSHVWYSMIRNTGSTPRWYDAVNLWRCDELPVSCTVLHTCRAVPLYQPNGVASLFVPTIYHHKNNSMMYANWSPPYPPLPPFFLLFL